MEPIRGVVLAGGASSRMGADKAFVHVAGRPMVLAVADALRSGGCADVVCQGGDAERLRSLGFVVLADTDPGSGPVSAIATARRRLDGTLVIAACDLPDLTGEAVASIVETSSRTGRVAVAVSGGRRHLLGAWPSGCGGLVASASGATRYGDLLDAVDAVDVPIEDADLRNVNRPEDVPDTDGRR